MDIYLHLLYPAIKRDRWEQLRQACTKRLSLQLKFLIKALIPSAMSVCIANDFSNIYFPCFPFD